jgi:2-polyprenyl-6-methoxyphenol hydroxylase-like FAD-dependent oxidoreductase
MIKTPVLIVGGGPIGLLLGHELSRYGVKALLVERNATTTVHPKMDITHARSVEHFRRIGVADELLAASVPHSSPMDVIWLSKQNEWELCRFRYDSVDQQRETIRNNNDGTGPMEPQMRISQIVVEPVLKNLLETKPEIDVRFGWGLESFEQDADGVSAVITETDTGKKEEVRCVYMAGCDGGGSSTRKQLGIDNDGSFQAVQMWMLHFRSRDYGLLQRHGVGWHDQTPVHGTLIAQDDDQYWTVLRPVPPGQDADAIDPQQHLLDSVGENFDFEMLQANPWYAHLLVANSFGHNRVWLAGDSAHQVIPTGGYGMNTGVADAAALGWKLAAMVQGWGGAKLLPAYESERHPVAVRNRTWSWEHMNVRVQIAQNYDPLIHEDSGQGADARAKTAQQILDMTNIENEGWGIQRGFRYEGSPLVCDEIGNPPSFDHQRYKPGSWPGTLPPHMFLKDGSAIYKKFGDYFTLLRFNGVNDTAILNAAKERGVPLTVVDIDDAHARELYERDLVLIRPDQFVAWRGNWSPANALEIIDTARGAL